jgi:hypothetical protein
MTNAASTQALEVGKERLREFLESSESGRQAMETVRLDRLNGDGKKMEQEDLDDI